MWLTHLCVVHGGLDLKVLDLKVAKLSVPFQLQVHFLDRRMAMRPTLTSSPDRLGSCSRSSLAS